MTKLLRQLKENFGKCEVCPSEQNVFHTMTNKVCALYSINEDVNKHVPTKRCRTHE